MKEILLTSSVLILALLILRRVFREKISRRMQYALWGLVLLRLLVPVNLPAADFSVLTAAAPVIGAADEHTLYLGPVRGTVSAPEDYGFAAIGPSSPDNTRVVTNENHVTSQIEYDRQIDLKATLQPVWFCGMAVMSLWLVGSNLRFWRKLRKSRIPLELPQCKHPVYLVEEGLASPCLFGSFRPAVYLTPAAMATEDGLRHVLVHEETHARQLDPLWSLLRGVCLVVYWFDPLVWLAAAASKEDCELSCDEGALKRLGEDERIPYGQTLLRLIPVKRMAGGVLLTATTMTSDKKRLTERITRIAENRKMKTAALCAVLALTAVVCAVTFTGCSSTEEPVEPAQPVDSAEPAEPDQPAEDAADAPDEPDSDGPVLTIPLTGLAPYVPQKVELHSTEDLYDASYSDHHDEPHDDHHEAYQDRHLVGGGCHTTENCSTFAWGYDGNVYVSSHDNRLSSFPDDYFLCFPEQGYRDEPFTYQEEAFDDILGYSGIMISYVGQVPEGYYDDISDYYVFDEDGVYLLIRVYGTPKLTDLDDDGIMELIGISSRRNWGCQMIFQRDGQLYEADLRALMSENWPELDGMSASYSLSDHCIDLIGPVFQDVWSDDSPGGRMEVLSREIQFDGENLLLYEMENKF